MNFYFVFVLLLFFKSLRIRSLRQSFSKKCQYHNLYEWWVHEGLHLYHVVSCGKIFVISKAVHNSPRDSTTSSGRSDLSLTLITTGWLGFDEGKSGFLSHTKLTAEATFMDLFHSWLITCTMWFWEFENKIAYLGAVKFKTKD